MKITVDPENGLLPDKYGKYSNVALEGHIFDKAEIQLPSRG